MDKKKYVSPRYELLKFDSRIVTTVQSKCTEAIVSVVYDPGRVDQCKTSDTTDTMWNNDWD